MQKSARQVAIDAGLKWYMPECACPVCEQRSIKQTYGGKCKFCHLPPDAHPRDVAIALREPWYMPKQPCGACEQHAARMVKTGKCLGCKFA